MRLLLDSHALLWWVLGDPRLSHAAASAIELGRNQVFVSAASAWEVAIKAAKGKLRLPAGGLGRLQSAITAGGFAELPVRWEHAFAVATLPHHHTDPFDRLLIAQCLIERLMLVTDDRMVRRYPLDCLW